MDSLCCAIHCILLHCLGFLEGIVGMPDVVRIELLASALSELFGMWHFLLYLLLALPQFVYLLISFFSELLRFVSCMGKNSVLQYQFLWVLRALCQPLTRVALSTKKT